MATYEEIYGKRVKEFDSDPTLESSYEGQVWYDKSSGVLKSVVSIEATRSATAMPGKKSLFGWGVGTSTAGLTVGGIDDSSYLNSCDEWNGSGWAAGGNYPTYRYSAGTAGTQTAAMAYCGRVPGSPGPGSPSETYEYNGSSWTSGNSFPTGGNSLQGIGAVDTAVVSTEIYTNTNMHHWNGTSWTSANARNTAKGGQAAFGSQTAAVLAGGFPSDSNITEVYDGTNWTSGNTMNTGRQQIAGSGTQTDGMAFGGDRPPTEAAQTTIESWDGTSWATSPATLATARSRAGAGRNTASGTWISGGIGPGGGGEAFDSVEIYEKSINTITAAAWANGDNMNTGSYNPAALVGGTQTAVIAAGGDTGGPAYSTTKSEEYDGSSWTATPTLNTARAAGTGTGTSTASIVFGAYPPSNAPATESWNGSSWTTTPATVGAPMERAGGSGTQTAALAFGYYNRPGNSNPTTVYSYNGSAWTTSPATMNSGRYGASGVGTQTAALAMGGITVSPAAQSAAVEQWDGSSWTTKSSLITARGYGGASGTYTSAIFFGGNPGSPTTATEGWDGTSWSTRPSLATTRGGMGSSGTSADLGISYGGGSQLTATEEFTGETSTVTAKTLTSS